MAKLNQTILQPFKAIVIDDSNLDTRIHPSELIERDEEVVVTNIYTDLDSFGQAYVLLDCDPEPHAGYRATRFSPKKGYYMPNLISIN